MWFMEGSQVSNFKKILAGAVFAATATVVATAASAAVIVTSTNGPDALPLPAGQTVLLDFESGPYPLSVLSGNYSIQTGGLPNQYAAPWQDLTNFIVVPATGSPSPQSATIHVGSLISGPVHTFSFYWGSNDQFNEVRLHTAGGTTIIPGSGSGQQGLPQTNQRYNFTLSGLDTQLVGIELYSNGKAFEADDFAFKSGVPEPATWAMMIMGFGGVGSMVRSARRKQAAMFA
ncbi:PEPxxWA-CTERM sorting domain-containing protein [Phenylobacterium sp. LH3H17]|nr:PEPxxWA-CTERM sorting domain-containing protein [Phenylobacterium sp. LH3H17]UTP41654.1 PEPxxWA-CTERM sorting domain-containing protein [Phenylobacterium sp. LH3H17]